MALAGGAANLVGGGAYPLGKRRSNYTFNHANFVESGGDFGTQVLGLNGSVIYSLKGGILLSGGFSARKSLVNDFFSRGASTATTENPWEINDVNVGAFAFNLMKIPVLNARLGGRASVSLPLSRPSRAAGQIAAANGGFSLAWSVMGFIINWSNGLNHIWTEEATRPVDCVRAPDVCRISGNDTGIANAKFNYNTSLGLTYPTLGTNFSSA